jgi:hypothetical protein
MPGARVFALLLFCAPLAVAADPPAADMPKCPPDWKVEVVAAHPK